MKTVAQISTNIEVQDTFDLGNGIRIQVISFNGEPKIDIRLWSQTYSGGWRPTKRGIRLSPAVWSKLLQTNEHLAADIWAVKTQQSVNKFYSVGDNIYASITSDRWKIDLRLWCLGADRVLKPGWKGITLNFSEWRNLMDLSTAINLARVRMQM